MSEPPQEIIGTWEEVTAYEAALRGRHVKLTLLDAKPATADTLLPETRLRPEPTPEQAALGILPAAIDDGTYSSILRLVQSIRREDNEWDGAIDGLWDAIAENRAMRRKMAEEAK